MSATIHKFVVPPFPGIHRFEIAGFHRWIDAAEQRGELVAWAEVVPGAAKQNVEIQVCWTGQPLVPTPHGEHLRSVQIGGLVHHVYSREAQ